MGNFAFGMVLGLFVMSLITSTSHFELRDELDGLQAQITELGSQTSQTVETK